MEATKPRLGRGLDALLSSNGSAVANAIPANNCIDLHRVQPNPFQPRKRFDDDELQQLGESIRVHGVLQPLVVRQVGEQYQLIAGERRLRAAQQVGLESVPVHVVNFDDQQIFEAALVENIQRSDLNAIEKAQGFKDYLERFGLTHDQLGQKLGLDRTTISNLLGLLNLPAEVQEAVRVGQLTLGHAKVIKGISDPQRQIALCREVILKSLSVHALEQSVKMARAEAVDEVQTVKLAKAPTEKTAHVQSLEDELRQRFAVRVEIKVKAKEKGQIVIGFDSNDDFERILEALRK